MSLQEESIPVTFRHLRQMRRLFRDRLLPVTFPVISLAAYWIGGEALLLLVAVTMPLMFLMMERLDMAGFGERRRADSVTGLMSEDAFLSETAARLAVSRVQGTTTACFVVEIDAFEDIAAKYGQAAGEMVLRECARRLGRVLRDGDLLARSGDASFAVCLAPVRQLNLEVCIQLAARLQAGVAAPVALDAMTIYTTGTIGFCLESRVADLTAPALYQAALTALEEAARHGPSSIRAYSEEMRHGAIMRHQISSEAAGALDRDEIRAWFQPQVSTDTGKVTGFEALARWEHPDRGPLPPQHFLETLERTGQLERLGQVMLQQALTALKAWDQAGLKVPEVGVNFSGDELSNPSLVERVGWEIDRFDLSPERIAVEVLETVMAGSPNDTVTRNINGLAQLGCRIDLDDFGTGNASIAAIRRFNVSRLKIDRSFVIKADKDPDQRSMIHAIITMAERLGVETLAEGVETSGEHAILAQLGCGHVQGYGIASPMPFAETAQWMKAHEKKLKCPTILGRKSG